MSGYYDILIPGPLKTRNHFRKRLFRGLIPALFSSYYPGKPDPHLDGDRSVGFLIPG